MSRDKNWCVYRHIAPNGKMYVGITSQLPQKRWNNGHGYKHSTYFFNAIKKYGWDNFKHEILLEGLSEEEASWAEEMFVECWDLIDRDKGYNCKNGGGVHGKHTIETKERIAQSSRDRWKDPVYKSRQSALTKEWWSVEDNKQRMREAQSKGMKGLPKSEEHKRKLREANIGKRHTKETLKKMSDRQSGGNNGHAKSVVVLDKESMKVIRKFDTMTEAAKFIGVSLSCVSECCNGNAYTAGGYICQYAEKATKTTKEDKQQKEKNKYEEDCKLE